VTDEPALAASILAPPPGEEAVPSGHAAAITELLASFARSALAPPSPVSGSVLNHNYRVDTAGGTLFVRVHGRARSRQQVLVEHAVMRAAAALGLPVMLPLGEDGRTVHAISGLLLSVFPWVDGTELVRGAIGVAGARALGTLHGLLHAVLSRVEVEGLPAGGTGSSWDTGQSIAALSRVDDLIRYYPAPSPASFAVQSVLRLQLGLLESAAARPVSEFACLPVQPVHGDFHERNVLFTAAGEPLAVVDWELAGVLPPVFELIRALDFCGLLEEPLLSAYLQGYRTHRLLSEEECELGPAMWWQSSLHDTWAYTTVFVRGNRRAARFFAEIEPRLRRFADPAFRAWLSAQLRAAAARTGKSL
jgi:Ser/Thr protein kinase RdoA (MazF antagonist)